MFVDDNPDWNMGPFPFGKITPRSPGSPGLVTLERLMTVGSKTVDNRSTRVLLRYFTAFGSPACSTNQGNVFVPEMGRYYSKVWSGGDAPKGIRRKPVRLVKFRYPVCRYDKRTKAYVFVRMRTVRQWVPDGTPPPPKGDHPYSMVLDDYEVEPANIRYYSPGQSCGGVGREGVVNTWVDYSALLDAPSGTWTSNDDIALIGKLGNRVQGASFNLLVSLGEAKESFNTIANASRRIARAAWHVRRGNILGALKQLSLDPQRYYKSAKHVAKDINSQWLSLRYGWRPLLNDIYNAARHLAFANNQDITQTFRVRTRKEGTFTRPRAAKETYSGAFVYEKRIIAKVTRFNQAIALGLTNPAAVAWELMPLSFVGDWVLPISNYLESMSISSALTANYVITTYQDVVTTKTEGTDLYNGGVYLQTYKKRRLQVDRSVTSSLVVPLPTWQNPLTSTDSPVKRCVDALSLLYQRTR